MPYHQEDEQTVSDRAAARAVVTAAITNALADEPTARLTAGDYSWSIPRLGIGMSADRLAGHIVDALRARRWLATPGRCGVFAGWGTAAGLILGLLLMYGLMTQGLAVAIPATLALVLGPAAAAYAARVIAIRRQR